VLQKVIERMKNAPIPKNPNYAQNSMPPQQYGYQNMVQNGDFFQILEKT
jgi:hypothetical protein